MLFFLGRLVMLDRVLNGAWCFGDHRFNHRFFSHGSNLDHFSSRSSSGSQFGFLLQTLGFTLAATHFTWVVWRTAVWRQGADRSGFNHWSRGFGNHWRFDHRCFNNWRWSRFGGFDHWRGSLGFFNHWGFNDWR